FSFQLYKSSNKKIYLLLVALYMIFIILTGSRKAILYTVISIIGIAILYSKNSVQLLRNVCLAIVTSIFVFYILINVPSLYEVAGQRIEALVFSLLGNGVGD